MKADDIHPHIDESNSAKSGKVVHLGGDLTVVNVGASHGDLPSLPERAEPRTLWTFCATFEM